MTTEEWLAANLATAPPLTQEQIAILRRIFWPVLHVKAASAGNLPPQEPREPASLLYDSTPPVRQPGGL